MMTLKFSAGLVAHRALWQYSVLNMSFGMFVKVMLTYVSFWPPFGQLLSNKENSLIYRCDWAEKVHYSDSNLPPIRTIFSSET